MKAAGASRFDAGPRREPALGASVLAAAACGLSLLSACSGEPFGLADGAAAQGGSAFPPLDTTDHRPDGGSLGGAGGRSSGPPGYDPSACGELRSGTTADDGEVCINAGTFTMGNDEVSHPQQGDYVPHRPAHEVTLSAYVLDAKEVTVARYRACVDAAACTAPSSTQQGCTYSATSGAQDRLPVTCVSWDDAMAFCNWDGGRRLPSEAEWERAARGTTGTDYAWGDDVSCLRAVFGGASACQEQYGRLTVPQPVGSTPNGASPEGALDLTGNAWEWVADWFGAYTAAAVTDPTGPNAGSTRILRGGNWQTPPANARAFMRRSAVPAAGGPASFRCARSVAVGSLGGFML